MKSLPLNPPSDNEAREELNEAGIPAAELAQPKPGEQYKVIGKLDPWEFRRKWLYWEAKAKGGQGLSKEAAEAMNVIFRETVRVQGYCRGTEVKTFLTPANTIDSYHIDTQEGLNAFSAIIKTIRGKIDAVGNGQ